jgi:hypothetical protein
VPSYAVRLEVRVEKGLTQAQLEQLDGGRHEVVASGKVRGRSLEVSLTMAAGDVVGALARALNVVLDVVPGEVRAAELVEQRPRPAPPRRRR